MSDFIYKLNAMERASQAAHPDKMCFAERRKAVLDYVAQLERELTAAKAALAEEKKLSEAISRDCNATALERNELQAKLAQAQLDKAEFDALRAKLAKFEQAALPTEPERLTLTRKLASGGVATETVVAAHHYDALRIRLARYEQAELPEEPVGCPTMSKRFIDYVAELRAFALAQKVLADDATTRATRAEATCRHYENALYTPGLKSTVVRNGNDAVEIKAERVVEIIERAHTIENETIERCVQLCLLERDKADKMEPRDTPGSTMNLDHLMGQGYMANLLAKKLQALKKEG